MSEQLTLFEEPLSFEDQLEKTLDAAREKSGYYKLHESGMYEMMKNAPQSNLHEILELSKSKSGDISFTFDGQLYIKFLIKKGAVNTTKELYAEFLTPMLYEELGKSKSPKDGVSVIMDPESQIGFFERALEYLIKTKKPVNRFGCCSQYQKCSQAGKCLHENQYYSKGCYYRENLENGKAFYK